VESSDQPNEAAAGAQPENQDQPQGRDEVYWAKGKPMLRVGEVSSEAVNLNVEGRRVMSPIHGFGKMWQKTYTVSIDRPDITPEEVIREWKKDFPKFWPAKNFFYGPLTGIAPGEVAVLNLSMPGRLKLSTGVLVLYADDVSFTLMTPQGHMFAGWITFSAYKSDDVVVAQTQVLMRANDPIYEAGLALGMHRKEDRFWRDTLRALAAHFGVSAEVTTVVLCVDKKRQWSKAKNVWHNSAIRSGVYATGAPFRALAKPFHRPN
jgi:hypothetical protein